MEYAKHATLSACSLAVICAPASLDPLAVSTFATLASCERDSTRAQCTPGAGSASISRIGLPSRKALMFSTVCGHIAPYVVSSTYPAKCMSRSDKRVQCQPDGTGQPTCTSKDPLIRVAYPYAATEPRSWRAGSVHPAGGAQCQRRRGRRLRVSWRRGRRGARPRR